MTEPNSPFPKGFAIVGDRLNIGGRPAPFYATPHQGGRIEPSLIIVHDTAGALRPGSTVDWFRNPRSKVSAHFVVERDGTVIQMADCDRKCAHAGLSEWRGRANCNGFAIGIEIVSPGRLLERGEECVHLTGDSKVVARFPVGNCVRESTPEHGDGWWLPYTDAQVSAVERLVAALARAYPTITGVAAHWEVSPGRKIDPGPLFPLGAMKQIVAGRLPVAVKTAREVQERLSDLGYWVGAVDGNVGPRTRASLRTFQEQNGLAVTGGLDGEVMDALFSEAAKEMPTGGREDTTPADLRADGSGQAKDSSLLKRVAEASGATAVGSALADAPAPPGSSAIDTAEQAVTSVARTKGLGDQAAELMAWALTPKGLITVAVLTLCAVVWKLADRIDWRRVWGARLGTNVGR